MEKQGVVKAGITPPEKTTICNHCKAAAAATQQALDQDARKRLLDGVVNSLVSNKTDQT
jgi:hypothetical protein